MTERGKSKDIRTWLKEHGLRFVTHVHGKHTVIFSDTEEACPICGQHGSQEEETN